MFRKFLLSIVGCLIVGGATGTDFPICMKDDEQGNPTVAWGRQRYLVVYSDRAGSGTWEDIYGKMVDTLADTSSQISICADTNPQMYPAVAFDGTKFLVAWEDNRTGDWDIYGRFLDTLGNAVGDTFRIAGTPPNRYGPVVGWNGTNYLVVWRESNTLKAIRVNSSGGTVGGEIAVCLGSLKTQPYPTYAVTSNGDDYLVVWEDTTTSGDIHGSRINSAGTPQGEFDVCAETGYQLVPGAAWTGSYYLVVWQGKPGEYRNEIYGIRLDSLGSAAGDYIPIREVDYVEVNGAYQPKVVGSDSLWFVVWEEKPMVGVDAIRGATVDTSGNVSDVLGISSPDSNERYVDIAFDGNGVEGNRWLVVWQDERQGIDNPDIYGTLTELPIVGIGFPSEKRLPSTMRLSITPTISGRNFSILYNIPAGASLLPVSLKVYDLSGRAVEALFEGWARPGSYTRSWDLSRETKSGVYLCRLEVGSLTVTKKLILVR